MISTLMPGSFTDNSTISMKSANVKIECYKSSKAKNDSEWLISKDI